jgi:hypothetical protein
MSISNVSENAILALIFNATAWANYADNAVVTPQTQVAFSLQTADPGEAGTMSTSEATYTSYARANVARTTGGFTAPSAGATNLVATLSFPAGTGGSGTVTFFEAGKTGGGAVDYLFSGTVTPNIITGNGVTPQLGTATSFTLD